MLARNTLALVIGAAVLAGPVLAGTTTVIGLDDVSVDRQNVQDAIDSASSGDTIELLGTFRFDGERVRLDTKKLTIVGESLDNDNDGKFQEDWADGVDNDGDGSTDEDDWETQIFGVDDGSGEPATDDGVNGLFNRAFVVDGLAGTLDGLTIRDIAFSTFHRAIELIPEWDSPTGRCDDRTNVNGSVRRLTIEGNRFSNNVLGITLLGATDASVVHRNVFLDNDTFGVVLEGGVVACPLSGGGEVDISLTTPRRNRIVDNYTFESSIGTGVTSGSLVAGNTLEESTGILTLNDHSTRISRNTLTDCFFGVIIEGGTKVLVDQNVVTGAFEAFFAGGAADRVRIVSNEGSASFIGLEIFEGSGFIVARNTLSAGVIADISIDAASSNNRIVNPGPANTVIDDGTDNEFIGNFIFL